MTDLLIETHFLRKSYVSRRGRHVAVDGLNLAVEAGGVHGFLGPNGSGKTTTIRLLLGLARPDSGEIKLLGQPVPRGLGVAMSQVGAVVEQPRLFNGFSGRGNLELLAKSAGLDKKRVDQVLKDVGMTQRAKDRYGSYSLGMKQRLAIAGAMLKDPRLLILDEPTNGLDPAGIHEIRSLIGTLAAKGTTVLVSSHILAEVQQVCDSVTIIARGKMLAHGPVEDVLASVSGEGRRFLVTVEPDQLAAATQLLGAAGLTATVGTAPGARPKNGQPASGAPTVTVTGAENPAVITETLARGGVYLSGLEPIGVNLESAFLQITEGQGVW